MSDNTQNTAEQDKRNAPPKETKGNEKNNTPNPSQATIEPPNSQENGCEKNNHVISSEATTSSATENEQSTAKTEDGKSQSTQTDEQTRQNPVSSCDFLKKLNLCLPLATLIAVFLGGFIIYKYLNEIGHPTLFPEVISRPEILITSTIYFLIFTFYLFFLSIFTPYLFKTRQKKMHRRELL